MENRKTVRIPAPGGGVDVEVSDYVPVIDTEEFQRLGRIRQLSCAFHVYPGAVHTRKEHSLGTLYFGREIGESVGLSEYNQRLLEMCCLLHDIGHGAYSHISETVARDVFGISHDDKIFDKLERIEEEIRLSGVNPDDVRSVFGKENRLYKLISTILGADKLDYITRDRLHCGLPTVDVEKIITYAVFDGNEYAVEEKAENLVTDFLKSWWSAHKEIYLRKSVEIADAVKTRMILYAIKNGEIKPEELYEMDDAELDYIIMKSENRSIEAMNRMFRERRLPKTAGALRMEGYELRENLRGKPILVEGVSEEEYKEVCEKLSSFDRVLELEERIRKEFGMEPQEIIITTSPGIERLRPKEVNMLRRGSQGRKDEIVSVYDFSKGRFREFLEEEMRGHWAVRIAVSEDKREGVYERLKNAGFKELFAEL